MTLKGDPIFKEKLTGDLKNEIRNLVIFHASSWKSKNFHFDWLVLSIAYKVLDEKVQKIYALWHWTAFQRKAIFWKYAFFV